MIFNVLAIDILLSVGVFHLDLNCIQYLYLFRKFPILVCFDARVIVSKNEVPRWEASPVHTWDDASARLILHLISYFTTHISLHVIFHRRQISTFFSDLMFSNLNNTVFLIILKNIAFLTVSVVINYFGC